MESAFSGNWGGLAGGENRTAAVVYPEGPIKAVWIFFHGAGGTGAWTLEESRLGPTAQKAGALLVFPEGRRKNPNQVPGFLSNPQVWDDASGRFDDYLSHGDDLEYVASLLKRIDSVAPGVPVHWIGFSNGAAFANRAARAFPGHVASLSMICGVPFPERGEARLAPIQPAPPLLTVHGGKDLLIPWEGGQAQSPWTRKWEHRPSVGSLLEQWSIAHGGFAQVENHAHDGLIRKLQPLQKPGVWAENYLVEDMGHHWPGGLGRINRRIAGPPSWRLDGNELIRDFCQRAQAPQTNPLEWVDHTHPRNFSPIAKAHQPIVAG